MPRSACFRAGTSLTPSPVMATTWPLVWRASTTARFWSGLHPAEDEVALDSVGEPAQVVGAVLGRRPALSPPGMPTVAGDGPDRRRVVAGEDLDGDALAGR